MPPPPTGILQYTICRGAHYPQGVRRIRKRQSRQRLRCVRPYNRFHEPCPMPYFCRARRPRRVVSVLRKSPVKHPTRRGRCPHRPAPRRRTPPHRTPPLREHQTKQGTGHPVPCLYSQNAKFPSTNTGTSSPSCVVPTMERSAVPTMKSTWVMESLRPAAFSCSLVISAPPSTHSG